MHRAKPFLVAAAAAACVISVHAQQDGKKSDRPETPKEFKALKYRNVGPAAGGRGPRRGRRAACGCRRTAALRGDPSSTRSRSPRSDPSPSPRAIRTSSTWEAAKRTDRKSVV